MKSAGAPASRMAFPAALLSFVVPGFGQFLIRAWVRGAIWLAGWFVVSAYAGAPHSPVVVALMLVAAVDAYILARSQPEPSGSAARGGPGGEERR
ncbi:MAG: hypothetical protein ABI726_06865 [bacterium]